MGATGTVVGNSGSGWERGSSAGEAHLYGVWEASGAQGALVVGRNAAVARSRGNSWITGLLGDDMSTVRRTSESPHLVRSGIPQEPEGEWVDLPVTFHHHRNISRVRNDVMARALLREVCPMLQQRDDILRFRITGHTHPWGAESGNDFLALERAQQVADLLVGMCLRPELVEIRSGGDTPETTASVDRSYYLRTMTSILVRSR